MALRVPPARGSATRLEHRLADGAAGVHLATAATLLAALRGVTKGLECPPAETQDCITGADADVTVPADLGAALDALETDKDFVEAFSPAYVEGFLAVETGRVGALQTAHDRLGDRRIPRVLLSNRWDPGGWWKVKKRDGPGGVGLLLAEGGGSGFQIRPTFLTFQAGLVTPPPPNLKQLFSGSADPGRDDARAVIRARASRQ